MRQHFKDEINQLHSRLCAGLADPTRILLLYALSECSRTVTELTEILELSQPTVSRHLRNLRERGLVIAERDGQSVRYSVADFRVIHALDLLRVILADHLSSQGTLAKSASKSLSQETTR